jgi:hypothetical protein
VHASRMGQCVCVCVCMCVCVCVCVRQQQQQCLSIAFMIKMVLSGGVELTGVSPEPSHDVVEYPCALLCLSRWLWLVAP